MKSTYVNDLAVIHGTNYDTSVRQISCNSFPFIFLFRMTRNPRSVPVTYEKKPFQGPLHALEKDWSDRKHFIGKMGLTQILMAGIIVT